MAGPTFLRGEAVTLRPIEGDDAPFLAETVNHPAVWPALATCTPTSTAEERDWIDNIDEDEAIHLLICADDDPVGTVGLTQINDAWGIAELGYFVHPDAQGNGYATDAARRIVRYGFADRRLKKVYANVFPDNDASRRVLESVGFQREGVFREHAFVRGERTDVHRYGLLADEVADDIGNEPAGTG